MMILGPITFHPLIVIARLVRAIQNPKFRPLGEAWITRTSRVMTAMDKTVQPKIIML